MIDYFFVIHKPSSVALSALLNSMEVIPSVSQAAKEDFLKEIMKVAQLDPMRQEIVDCRNRLHLLYAEGGYSHRDNSRTETRTETVSPVCVSYGVVNPNSYPQVVPAYASETESKNQPERSLVQPGTLTEQ